MAEPRTRPNGGRAWSFTAGESADYERKPRGGPEWDWSYQLHADNLAALIQREPVLGTAPSYCSVVRFMKAQGLIKRPRRGPVNSPGAQLTRASHRDSGDPQS